MRRLLGRIMATAVTLAVGAGLLVGGVPALEPLTATPAGASRSIEPVDYGGGPPPIVRTPFLRPYFEFSAEVPAEHRALVRQTIRQANRLFTLPHEKNPPDAVDVFVFSDREAVLEHFAHRVGVSLEDAHRQWQSAGGKAGLGWMTVDLTSYPADDDKREAMFHEWFHLVDFHLQGREEPPAWLVEGMAEWAGWHGAVRFGDGVSSDWVRAMMRALSSGTEPSLRSLEAPRRFYGTVPLDRAYATAFWAVESLDPTVRKLLRFSRRVGDSGDWESAFRDVFGTSVRRFYQRFERFRARGLA